MKSDRIGSFAEIYLFSYGAKRIMGIYFLTFALVYLILGKIGTASDVTLDLWTALQMMVACMLIGYGQELIVPVARLSVKRAAWWMLWAVGVTIGSVLVWGWFDGFPPWCGIVFCVLMTLGLAALLLGLLYDSRRETRQLNEHLKAYQDNLK